MCTWNYLFTWNHWGSKFHVSRCVMDFIMTWQNQRQPPGVKQWKMELPVLPLILFTRFLFLIKSIFPDVRVWCARHKVFVGVGRKKKNIGGPSNILSSLTLVDILQKTTGVSFYFYKNSALVSILWFSNSRQRAQFNVVHIKCFEQKEEIKRAHRW